MSADERHREMPTRAPHINRKGHCSDRDNGGGTAAGPRDQVPGVPHLPPGGSGAGSAPPPVPGDKLPTVPQDQAEPVGHETAADLRRITLDGRAAPLAGRVMLDLTWDLGYEAAGGLTMGADPVATAMMHAAAARGTPIDAFVVRKKEKDHGTQRRIEGPDVAGRRVLAVEDTSTTGTSPLTAVDALREASAEVVGVAVLVNRGAREPVTERGLIFRAAYDLSDLEI